MVSLQLKGHITKDGELKVELPDGLPAVEVNVTIELPADARIQTASPNDDWENRPWTDEEIKELMRVEPKTGAESIALGHAGGWEDKGITDSVEWVEELRRKRRENRGISW
jgi:hypothetical protein